MGWIPGLGRSPGEGNGNPLQYSCLENPIFRGAWWAIQFMGLQRVRYDSATKQTCCHITVQNYDTLVGYLQTPQLLEVITFSYSLQETRWWGPVLGCSWCPVSPLCWYIPQQARAGTSHWMVKVWVARAAHNKGLFEWGSKAFHWLKQNQWDGICTLYILLGGPARKSDPLLERSSALEALIIHHTHRAQRTLNSSTNSRAGAMLHRLQVVRDVL